MAAYSSSTAASDRQLRSGFLPCSSNKRRRVHSTEVSSPAPMATTICKLDDDVLVEILIRLPNPRAAARCKAVCKGWRSLISDPILFNRRFVSHHRSRNRHPPLLLHSYDPQSIVRSIIPVTRARAIIRESFAVLDSYKDLVLCGFEDVGPASFDFEELYRSYFLCNPFTKQWVALPLAPELPMGHEDFLVRLVCEPRISNDLDLGDNQVFVYSAEYRFRVVFLYRHSGSTKLNVFCSDTGKWTKDALVLDEHHQFMNRNVVSCNGEVFWCYGVPTQDPAAAGGVNVNHPLKPLVAAFNPFRPDVPPTAIDVAPLVFGKPGWDISVSQGALHAIVFEDQLRHGPSQNVATSVWRLEEGRKAWWKLCDGLLKRSRLYELRSYLRPCLHPEKPEVFFLRHYDTSSETGDVSALSCDLGTRGEVEFFAEGRPFLSYWNLFQAEFSCWPTSIPRYEELRVMYDGSYSCWVQSNNERTDDNFSNSWYFCL